MAREAELASIAEVFRSVHPKARQVNEWNIDGWAVTVQAEPPNWTGTMPPTDLVLLPTEKKAGLTIHLWDPRDPELMQRNAAWLKEAGFKPMVGCLQWNRKAPVDLEALEKLFRETV